MCVELYIPQTLEEARKIVPNIDRVRFLKWQREGAVELVLDRVYTLPIHVNEVVLDEEHPHFIALGPDGDVKKPLNMWLKRCIDLTAHNGYFELEPGNMYIVATEPVRIPRNILPIDVRFRSTFHRFGYIGVCSNIDPGYEGRIYTLLYIPRNAPRLKIKRGTSIIQVRFLKLEKELEGYTGQWQGL